MQSQTRFSNHKLLKVTQFFLGSNNRVVIENIPPLGAGTSAMVRKGELIRNNDEQNKITVAIKMAPVEFTDYSELQEENKILSYIQDKNNSFPSPYILQYYGYHYDLGWDTGLFCMEYVSSNLTAKLQQLSISSQHQQVVVMKGIAQGIHYLHGIGIIHCDIKPGNILIDDQLTKIKICDFGLSVFREAVSKNYRNCTPLCAAPEILVNFEMGDHINAMNEASDVYSAGLVFWNIISGEDKAYSALENDPSEFFQKVIYENHRESIPDNYLPDVATMIKLGCWAKEPTARPSTQEMISILDAACQIDEKIGMKI